MSAGDYSFRAGAKGDELMVWHGGPGGPGGNLCFRPGDDGEELLAHHLVPGGGGGYACFHPGDRDGEPVARHAEPGGGGTLCFHPATRATSRRRGTSGPAVAAAAPPASTPATIWRRTCTSR